MGVRRRQWVIALALLGASACDEHIGCAPVLTTDKGQLELHDQAITVDACRRLREPAPLLEGAIWCPAVKCGGDVAGCEDDEGDKLADGTVAACFEQTLSGPVERDDPCLRMTEPGEASWSFAAVPCAAQQDGYAPADDRIGWSVVGVDEITAHLQSPGDAFALRSLVDEDGEPLPDDDALAPGDVAYAVADTAVPFAVVLEHPDHDVAVGWNSPLWDVVAEAVSGPEPELRWEDLGLVTVTIAAGAEARLSLVPGPDAGVERTVPIGTVIGVAPDALTSLEVVAGFAPPPDESGLKHGPVAGARAIVVTADGNPVYGANVQWEILEGELPLWRDETLPWTADYVALGELDGAACHDPVERTRTFEATVEASLGDLSDEVSVQWTEAAPDDGLFGALGDLFDPDDPPPKSTHCQGPGFPDEAQGCGCTAQNAKSTPTIAGMLLLLIAFRRLSRRRTRR